MSKILDLTTEQTAICIGVLLGDAHLSKYESKTKGVLHFSQSDAHKAYVDHLSDLFKDYYAQTAIGKFGTK